MTRKQTSAGDHRMLAHLPKHERAELERHLQAIELPFSMALILPHEPIQFVYFPTTALASLVTVFEDGATVESGCVGREGFVGVPVILGAVATPMQTVVQVPGDGFRIAADAFRDAYERLPALHDVVNRYIHTIFINASQSAACNRRHLVEARLARWLLTSADGIASDEVHITQEYLSAMLGVRRPGVTEAALKLQSANLIRYSRGLVEITDRPGLEEAACECYGVIKVELDRLFA
ncbi:MAG TPA: Crp/Fnr family transcriptional regulator [Thermoanaerobaculia bacterium]|nr:Crp/Fnr family transcriptional regulator [Thermoanaerobaculia bacterium]